MGDSLQDVYAKHLPNDYGYPLRTPEPSNSLPESYQNDGLQIGDVGFVDKSGKFHVVLNIRKNVSDELHKMKSIPIHILPTAPHNAKEIDPTPYEIPPDHVIYSSHITKEIGEHSYQFTSTSSAGSILILPSGATRHELEDITEFRRVAAEFAGSWCAFANRDSVYLITGLYKARSWGLASFHNAPSSGEIRVVRRAEQNDNAGIYRWESQFNINPRNCPKGDQNTNDNQTIFISGFKITVKLRYWVDVDLVPRPPTAWIYSTRIVALLISLCAVLWSYLSQNTLEEVISLEGVLRLSQPFHPSDAINKYLLDQNPEATVAITHDSDWLTMLKKRELTSEDLMQETRLRQVLSKRCSCVSDRNTVYLQRKTHVTRQASISADDLEGSSPRGLSVNQLIITHMRAQNIAPGPRRIPVGFFVVVHSEGVKWRTTGKSGLLRDSVVEWDNEIPLTMNPSCKIKFTICASFELDPILGNGEVLHTQEIDGRDLVSSTHLITFPSERTSRSRPSLLVTLQGCRSNHPVMHNPASSCDWMDSSSFVEATNRGHGALSCYHKEHKKEYLDRSVGYFQRALGWHDFRAPALCNLARAKFTRYLVQGTPSDLNEAISDYREALKLRPDRHHDRPATLLSLADALVHRYRTLGCGDDMSREIEELIAALQTICPNDSHERLATDLVLQTYKRIRAVFSLNSSELDELIMELDHATRALPEGRFDRSERLENLRVALLARFTLHRDPRDAAHAISKLQEAVQTTPDDHPDKPTYLNSLGVTLLVRFNCFGDVADLQQSIIRLEGALCQTPEHHRDRARILNDLGLSLRAHFDISGCLRDLEQAISSHKQALQLAPRHHPDRARILSGLGFSLSARFNRSGFLDDLEQSIASHEQALQLTPERHPDRARHLNNLGLALKTLFDRTGDIHNLEQSISMQEDALHATPPNHTNYACHLNDLALSFKARFDRFGDPNALKQAMARHEEALRLTLEHYPEYARCQDIAGLLLGAHFDRFGDVDALEKALKMQESAVQLTAKNHPDRARRLHCLSLSLHARFERFGDLNDLKQALTNHEDAVRLTPEDHPDRARHLHGLGLSLHTRFERFGDVNDLKQALRRHEDVVRLTPKDHPDRARHLHSLGLCLRTHFGRFGDVNSLEQAIVSHEDAVRLTPENHPNHAHYLNSLGLSLWTRFDQFGDIDDLERAISRQEKVLQATPHDHPSRSPRLHALSLSFWSRFNQQGNLHDLENAIAKQQDAFRLTPHKHPSSTAQLHSIGLFFWSRFNRLGRISDLEQAIAKQEDALKLIPHDHPLRALYQNSFSVILAIRFQLSKDPHDLERAIEGLRQALRRTPPDHPHYRCYLDNLQNFENLQCRDIVFLGPCGVGTSSIINLLLGSSAPDPAPHAPTPWTTNHTCYKRQVNGVWYTLWDICSSCEAPFGYDSKSTPKHREFLRQIFRHGKIDLLVHCVHGPEVAKVGEMHCKELNAMIRRFVAPVVIVVNGLESVPDMEGWMESNVSQFGEINVAFDDHASLTTRLDDPRADESRKKLVELITREYNWKPQGYPPTGSFFDSSVSFPSNHSNSRKKSRRSSQDSDRDALNSMRVTSVLSATAALDLFRRYQVEREDAGEQPL